MLPTVRPGRKTLAGAAVAVLAALAVSAPAMAAPTAVERYSSASSESSLNFAQPGDAVGFHFTMIERKAG